MEGGETDSAGSQQKELGLLRRGREAGAAPERSGRDGGLRLELLRGRGWEWRPQTGAAPARCALA